jgi:hypothetical protein
LQFFSSENVQGRLGYENCCARQENGGGGWGTQNSDFNDGLALVISEDWIECA